MAEAYETLQDSGNIALGKARGPLRSMAIRDST